jgi:spermidine/putrescine ABC transporter ATP-binding subunit
MSRVRLDGITGRYGDHVALERLDLTVEEGEFLTLLGPSGCGKTTTLRLIAGFLAPASGRIYFDDEDVSNRTPNKRLIGMVFQDYALFPHMTVADNIGFGLRERGVPRAEIRHRVAELLDLVQLPGLEERYPAQLSGGQRQRVALARAVAFPPRVLLMDEPLGALDLKLREAMQDEIQRIQRELGITTVYVTHDQTEAMTMSDRIAVMDRGRLVQLATAEELYNHPRNRFVAEFIGKINIIPIEALGDENGMTTVRAGGSVIRVAEVRASARDGAVFAIRPEHLRLRAATDPADGENSIAGRVAELRYSGNLVRCHVDAGGGLIVVVETSPENGLAVTGQAVRVTWPYTRGSILADEVAKPAAVEQREAAE